MELTLQWETEIDEKANEQLNCKVRGMEMIDRHEGNGKLGAGEWLCGIALGSLDSRTRDSGTYFELAAFILAQLPDKGSDDDHNCFSDVIARKRAFELTLWASRDRTGHQNTSAFQRDTFS